MIAREQMNDPEAELEELECLIEKYNEIKKVIFKLNHDQGILARKIIKVTRELFTFKEDD